MGMKNIPVHFSMTWNGICEWDKRMQEWHNGRDKKHSLHRYIGILSGFPHTQGFLTASSNRQKRIAFWNVEKCGANRDIKTEAPYGMMVNFESKT